MEMKKCTLKQVKHLHIKTNCCFNLYWVPIALYLHMSQQEQSGPCPIDLKLAEFCFKPEAL